MTSLTSCNQFHITGLLEKMTNIDKDFRYMAINDLMVELSKQSITLDEDMEKRIVKALLILLQDKNGEVQNLACRCLGPLVHKIKLQQLESLIDSLCTNIGTKEEQLRDVSSIALKTVLNELPSGSVNQQICNCVRRVVPKLVETLNTEHKTDSSVKMEVLDVLASLILRYGRNADLCFDEIETVLFQQLERERLTLRKRAITALGYLADVVHDEQFDRILKRILEVYSNPKVDLGILKTFILASITACRASATRFSVFISKFVPVLIKKCQTVDDDEFREICLQAFETFVFRCTPEMEPYISEISKIAIEMLCYDPNYNYGPEEEAEDETAEMEVETGDAPTTPDDDNEEDDDQDDGYSDDDDMSWKVRRAAAKCIEALITYRPDALNANVDKFGSLLISRFKEREQNVKYDVFSAYSSILKLARQFMPELTAMHVQGPYNNEPMPEHFPPSRFQQILAEELSESQRLIFEKLRKQVPSIMKAMQKEFKGKNMTTRMHAFGLLSHLMRTYPGILTDYLAIIAPVICSTLTDSNNTDGNMKIETLRFATLVLGTHDPEDLQQFVRAILPPLAKSIEDQFYKTAGEALITAQSALHVLFKLKDSGADVSTAVPKIYTAVVAKLRITDIDQEVKEKTILTTGLLLSMFVPELGSKTTDECLRLLLDRLGNEMTRQVTLRAINTIVRSPMKLELAPVLNDLLSLCADFLRKNQRSLRLNTLLLLESLVTRFFHNGLQGPSLIKVVKEIPALITEQDMQISQIAITFTTSVVNSYPDQIPADSLNNLFKSLICLLQSSLLQGSTLTAALGLLTALIRSPLPNKPSFEEIQERISQPVYSSSLQMLHRQAYNTIAKAIATTARATGDQKKCANLIKQLRKALSDETMSDSVRLFAILSLGELGKHCQSVIETLENEISIEKLIIEAFASPLEEIKSAASYSLGSLATGNLGKYLPFLLREISKEEKKQYLFLHALKEVINSQCDEQGTLVDADKAFLNGIVPIWSVLIKYCDSSEESIRNIVAECIGKLCMVNPEYYVMELLNHSTNPSANIRAAVVTALRFIVVEQPRAIDEYVRPLLGKFLGTIRDEDLNARRVAIVTLNSVAHNKPKMIKECLPELLPALYEETKVKEELIHEVEMGPFKHQIDDGLDLRKAAFECMYTLADQCLDRVNLPEYLTYVENGLKDQHDIKLLTYLMLIRLVQKCPIRVSQRLDEFCEQIKPQLLRRPKQNAVKQENDKQDELKRSAVRAVIALKRVPNSDRSQKMTDIWGIINSNPELTAMKEVQSREQQQQVWTGVNGYGAGNEAAMEVE